MQPTLLYTPAARPYPLIAQCNVVVDREDAAEKNEGGLGPHLATTTLDILLQTAV